jgi:hypothetical protein
MLQVNILDTKTVKTEELIDSPHRKSIRHLALARMPGHRLITRLMWQLLFILKRTAYRFAFYLISSKFRIPILALIWRSLFRKSLKTLGLQIKSVSSKILIQNSNDLLSTQILSVTCDNATSNDVMIDHLENLLEEFPGSANRTRCFAHILNLVTKCIMRQFDAPKSKKKEAKDDLDGDLDVLVDEELESEDDDDDEAMADADDEDDGKENPDVEEDVDLPDVRDELTEEEIEELETSVKPVKLVLQKVRVDLL